MDPEQLTTFVNTTQGWVGAIKIRRNGDRDSVAIEPGGRIDLTEEEQQLMADAPRSAENSPFIPRPYQHFDEAGEVIAEGVQAQLEEFKEERPTPAKRKRAAPKGRRNPKEVVGA